MWNWAYVAEKMARKSEIKEFEDRKRAKDAQEKVLNYDFPKLGLQSK
jgi:hypothetical protein